MAKKGTTTLKIRAVKPGDKAGKITIKNGAQPFTPRTNRTTQRYAKGASKRKMA